MTCEECEYEQEHGGGVAYFRWVSPNDKTVANIGLIGCRKHIKEVLDLLNSRDR